MPGNGCRRCMRSRCGQSRRHLQPLRRGRQFACPFLNSLEILHAVQIPLGMFTVSVFYNIPSSPSSALNLTACMVQKLLTGSITTW